MLWMTQQWNIGELNMTFLAFSVCMRQPIRHTWWKGNHGFGEQKSEGGKQSIWTRGSPTIMPDSSKWMGVERGPSARRQPSAEWGCPTRGTDREGNIRQGFHSYWQRKDKDSKSSCCFGLESVLGWINWIAGQTAGTIASRHTLHNKRRYCFYRKAIVAILFQ